MILDSLENCSAYFPLNSRFAKAFEFLCRTDITDLAPGEYEIEGREVFAIVVNDQGRKKADGLLEIHRRYVDIQCVLAGTDEMGWKPLKSCSKPTADFDQSIDAQLFKDEPATWFSVPPNGYAIFFPQDAHMAMFSDARIHKVIMKVAVD